MDISAKICNHCKQELDISRFHKHKREKDGYRQACKICRKIIEVRDPLKRKLCRNKPENKIKEKEYMIEYREKNKERLKEYSRESNIKNRKRQLEWRKNFYNKILKFDPIYRMSHSMSGRLLDFLKGKKNNQHWETILGYSKDDLKIRMKTLFKDNMTFENYGRGGWHIDHIIPLKYKNQDGNYYWNQEELTDVNSETFRKAWGLDNLQPLWEKDNFSKSNRYIG